MNNRAAVNPPAQPAQRPPLGRIAAPLEDDRRRPQPRAERQGRHWSWYLVYVLVFLMFRACDSNTNSRNSYVLTPRATWTESPYIQQARTTLTAYSAYFATLEGTYPGIIGSLTPERTPNRTAIPTRTPVPAPCDVTELETTVTFNPAIVEGGGIVYRVDTYSHYCVGIPLRVGIWLERVNGQIFLAPNADPLYRLATGKITIQARIAPMGLESIDFTELILPLRQLSLPSGTYELAGSVDARDWDTGRMLYNTNYPPLTITIP